MNANSAQRIAELDQALLSFIRKGIDSDDPETFNRLALRLFRLQFDLIPIYRRYCERRGMTPKEISTWELIPAIPTDVFKTVDLALLPSQVVRTFMTSGTTVPGERGRVHYDPGGLRLMDATIEMAASAFLFPDRIRPTLLIIAPPPRLAPHMIMAYGMERLKDHFGLPQSRFLIKEEGFDVEVLVNALKQSEAEGIPTCLCGASFGLVNFFDHCRRKGLRFKLPPGSRCLDAGGFKGKSREVSREEFLTDCEELLNIPEGWCVNLLGMTEISSQFYDNTLRHLIRGDKERKAKVNPPWTRTLVVDPDTLDPVPHGEIGLLKHFDLANRGHICAIQTGDLGQRVEGGFEVYGRALQGESRGCSLTVDEMTHLSEEE